MFWIHGGGYMVGESDEIYGPEFLLDKDVILVSINYRFIIFLNHSIISSVYKLRLVLRSCNSIKYVLNSFLLSELLLNKKLWNLYLIIVDERDIVL